jgi:hypothetical protein
MKYFPATAWIVVATATLVLGAAPGTSIVHTVGTKNPGQARSNSNGGCYLYGKWYPDGATVPLSSGNHWNVAERFGICKDGQICAGRFCFALPAKS